MQVALLTSLSPQPPPAFAPRFFFLSLSQALILSGITGLTARPIETLCRGSVKLAAPYIAFH